MLRPSVRSGGALILLALILVLATGLRFYRLDAQSFWNDEGNSARIAERPLSQIVAGAAGDIHPPGYYILLSGWRALAGSSAFALRLLSALAGVLTVALVYGIGARLFGRRVGLLAALLAAIAPLQVYYGQEARMYALLGLLSAASIRLTVAVLTVPARMVAGRFDPRQAGAVIGGYILVNAAGLYTHYSFPLMIGVETLVFLTWLAGRSKRIHGLATWALIQGATAILFAPWLLIAIRQVTGWPSGGSPPADLAEVATTLAYGVTLPLDTARVGLIPLLIVAVLGLFPPIEEGPQRALRFEERIGLVTGWLLLPLATLAGIGALSTSFLKFLVPCGLALNLLVARGALMIVDLGKPLPGVDGSARLTWLIGAVLLSSGLYPTVAGLRHLYFDPRYARDDYRAIAARIMAEAGPQAAVVLDAPNQWEVFTYYYPDGPGVTPLPNDATEATLARLLESYPRIYALYWGTEQQDPQALVERMLSANAFVVSTDWYGGVRLVRYAVPGRPATHIKIPIGACFGGIIILEGFTLSTESLAPGDALGVSLFWRAEAPPGARYKVFVHLYAPDGTISTQHDGEPVGGLAPTDGWEVGWMVIDHHGLLLPLEAPPGIYRLVVGLYDFSGARLPLDDGSDALLLAEVPVQ